MNRLKLLSLLFAGALLVGACKQKPAYKYPAGNMSLRGQWRSRNAGVLPLRILMIGKSPCIYSLHWKMWI